MESAMSSEARIGMRAVYMRGGTSKGVFFHAKDLPEDTALRDKFFLRALGSPDPFGKQIDGIGAATSSTSKIAIISPSHRSDCDVDYFFGQVALDKPLIDYSTTCGNLLAAVGPFAVEEGLAPSTDGEVVVRIWQANLKQRIVSRFQVQDGVPLEAGDFSLDGLPFSGSEIELQFLDASESRFVLPTQNAMDQIVVDGRTMNVSLIEAGAPTVIIRAEDVSIVGTETPDMLNADRLLLARIEVIRSHAAVKFGIADSVQEAANKPAVPKVAIVTNPQSYKTTSGSTVEAQSIDIVARVVSMGKIHHACPVSAASALAVACAIPGTVCSAIYPAHESGRGVNIGHAAGNLSVEAIVTQEPDGWTSEGITLSRTARRLMEGTLFAVI
jgi:2-methylaconitate cis-trans-isomerase PrpF